MNKNKIIQKNQINQCPKASGIYWLYTNTEHGWITIYIGISVNINRRLKQHSLEKEFDGFFYELKTIKEARNKEKQLLKSYRLLSGSLPTLNLQI